MIELIILVFLLLLWSLCAALFAACVIYFAANTKPRRIPYDSAITEPVALCQPNRSQNV